MKNFLSEFTSSQSWCFLVVERGGGGGGGGGGSASGHNQPAKHPNDHSDQRSRFAHWGRATKTESFIFQKTLSPSRYAP